MNKNCGGCVWFAYLSAQLCETLNIAVNPFSLWFRICLGYGFCKGKNKLVRKGTAACDKYEEEIRL
jgi:hypothetical protein